MHFSVHPLKKNITHSSLKDIFIIGFLSFIVFFFIFVNSDDSQISPLGSLKIFLLIFLSVFGIWLILLAKDYPFLSSLMSARIILSPILILALTFPYSYFYKQLDASQQLISLLVILLGVVGMFSLLYDRQKVLSPHILLFFSITIYCAFFSTVDVLHYLNYQSGNTPDIGLYNQIQWNNIHGHFLESSTSGSNFVTHNSPFLFFLTPLYALYPSPQTLLILKTCFIGFSAFPFFLVAKHFLNEKAALLFSISYLFFPFIVGQNFNAPHEMVFLPPFLLFCFYFFLKSKFREFILFLLISLSVKEHLAIISVMLGLYALVLRRQKEWILTPIILGIFWAFFSLWIMSHFQMIYNVDPAPAWLIVEIKRNFTHADTSILNNIILGLKETNLGQWNKFCLVYLLLSPLIVFLPFGSVIFLIGLPELLINLLASRPLIYPTWHYNIIISCFLIIACAATVSKLSLNLLNKFKLPLHKIQTTLSWFLLVCTVSHFFLWSDYLSLKENKIYTKTLNEAALLIPKEASVSIPKYLAGYFSSRRDYFLLSDPRKGEYMILDTNEATQDDRYTEIFNRNSIRVYKQIHP